MASVHKQNSKQHEGSNSIQFKIILLEFKQIHLDPFYFSKFDYFVHFLNCLLKVCHFSLALFVSLAKISGLKIVYNTLLLTLGQVMCIADQIF